ncbi:hypothetical protein GCM10023205_47930 [Yinghuangia aomiensis]|uniref:Uncharacterized protein n=1 Tax=Yinghuangia aomiensis TaxID=676205 RepID=A0ABP9HP55_9ACTN
MQAVQPQPVAVVGAIGHREPGDETTVMVAVAVAVFSAVFWAVFLTVLGMAVFRVAVFLTVFRVAMFRVAVFVLGVAVLRDVDGPRAVPARRQVPADVRQRVADPRRMRDHRVRLGPGHRRPHRGEDVVVPRTRHSADHQGRCRRRPVGEPRSVRAEFRLQCEALAGRAGQRHRQDGRTARRRRAKPRAQAHRRAPSRHA